MSDGASRSAFHPDGPLHGKRIIEVGGRMVSHAGRLLADLGADFVVLESPRGEEARSVAPVVTASNGDAVSLDHAFRQQTKRSLSIDWTNPEAFAAAAPGGRRCRRCTRHVTARTRCGWAGPRAGVAVGRPAHRRV